jgi:G3E family GTPase
MPKSSLQIFPKYRWKKILNTERFDFERAQQHPVWFKELYGFANHVPETEEYGVTNFVYRARRPLDPQKFHAFITSNWSGVWGDRRQEIVFIGTGMDTAELTRRLDACLVATTGKDEMNLAAWAKLRDPFPVWRRADEAA